MLGEWHLVNSIKGKIHLSRLCLLFFHSAPTLSLFSLAKETMTPGCLAWSMLSQVRFKVQFLCLAMWLTTFWKCSTANATFLPCQAVVKGLASYISRPCAGRNHVLVAKSMRPGA